LPETTK